MVFLQNARYVQINARYVQVSYRKNAEFYNMDKGTVPLIDKHREEHLKQTPPPAKRWGPFFLFATAPPIFPQILVRPLSPEQNTNLMAVPKHLLPVPQREAPWPARPIDCKV